MRAQVQALVNGMPFDAVNQQSVAIPVSGILAAGVPADIGSVSIPFARYLILSAIVEVLTAAGTLALGTVDLRTAAGGAGASVLPAPVALASLTAANTAQVIPAVQTAVQTAPVLTFRQTVVSANVGNISGMIVVQPLP